MADFVVITTWKADHFQTANKNSSSHGLPTIQPDKGNARFRTVDIETRKPPVILRTIKDYKYIFGTMQPEEPTLLEDNWGRPTTQV